MSMNSDAAGKKTVVRVRNVGVSYSRRAGFLRNTAFWALHDVSFDLYHGETLGIVGRNGAGKSTLLRVLAGIMAPDRGAIAFEAGCRASLLSLQVGFVPYLSGRENAILSGLLLGMHRREIEERMPAITEFSGLGDFIDEPIRSYSTGMRARLGFAVAFHANPEILLVDEVLGVGDEEFREKSSQAIKERIHSDHTVVLVSHQVQALLDLCDRLVWVEGGTTRMEGDARTVMDAYHAYLKSKAGKP